MIDWTGAKSLKFPLTDKLLILYSDSILVSSGMGPVMRYGNSQLSLQSDESYACAVLFACPPLLPPLAPASLIFSLSLSLSLCVSLSLSFSLSCAHPLGLILNSIISGKFS